MPDDRDLVIRELADSEHTLAREAAGLREVLHAAVEQVHALTVERDRLQARLRRVQNRWLRAHQRDTTTRAA